MAIKMATAGDALKRTTNVVPASSDYTCCFWWRYTGAQNQKALFYTGEAPVTATAWARIRGIFSTFYRTASSVAVASVETPIVPSVQLPAASRWVPVAYTRAGNVHTVYLDIVVASTLTLDISSATFAETWIGDDTFGNPLGQFCNFREWTEALTFDELTDEWQASSAVRAVDLWTDTPLLSDLLDDSGHGHDWTAVGTPGFVGTPPLNLYPQFATDLGTSYGELVTQDVGSDGAPHTVWYRRTAQAGETVLGTFGFGALSGYTPQNYVYHGGSAASPTLWPDPNYVASLNAPMQFPAYAGDEYLLEYRPVVGNTSPATLTVTVTRAPTVAWQIGDPFINDDTGGLPAAIIDPDAADIGDAVRAFVRGFPASENGDVFPTSGRLIFQDGFENSGHNLKIFDGATMELLSSTDLGKSADVRMNVQTETCWFGTAGAGSVHATIGTIDEEGVVGGGAWTLPSAGLVSFATSPDETILYHVGQAGTTSIKRWDLVNNAALSDLAAAVSGYTVTDLLVRDDGTIVALYFKGSVTRDVFLRTIAPDGTALATYPLGPGSGNYTTTTARMGYGLDDTTVTLMYHVTTPTGYTYVESIRLSDGAVLSSLPVMTFEGGASQAAKSATPEAFFGASFSCPIVTLRLAKVAGTGTLIVRKVTVPAGSAQPFPVHTPALVPATVNLVDGGTYTYTGIDADTYAVSETVPFGWQQSSVVVSNGDDPSAITIGSDETVTVTFTNAMIPVTPSTPLNGTLLRLRRLRRTAHLSNEQKRTFYRRLQLDMQVGVGLISGQGSDPQLMLRWSDDGGRTWSNEHWISAGLLGQYGLRAIWRRLGSGRDRVFELVVSDPVAWRFVNAYLDVEEGSN